MEPVYGNIAAWASSPFLLPLPLLPTLFAQSGFGLIDPPAPPPLPRPPFFEHYLFENPWPLVVLLAVAGAVCFLRLRGTGKNTGALVAAGCLLVCALGAWLLAGSVETGREAIARKTEELVAGAARADVSALDALLSEDLSLFRPGGGESLGKAETLERVRRDLGGFYKIGNWAVLDVQSMTDSPRTGVTQARVRVTLEAAGFPNISWWKIDWRKGPDGEWRAVTIDPKSVTPEVRGQFR